LDNILVDSLKIEGASSVPQERTWELGIFDRATHKFNKINKLSR